MAHNFLVDMASRDAMATTYSSGIGGSAILRLLAAFPATIADADGTVLATGTLPATVFTEANGVLTKAGTWTITGAVGAGTGTVALAFRIYTAGGVCKGQGTVGQTGGTACDMMLDNPNIANTQVATVGTCTVQVAQ